MPVLTGNDITANGTYTVTTHPGEKYIFTVSGAFGGGSLALHYNDGVDSVAYTGSPVTSAATISFVAAAGTAELILSGATSPDLDVSIRQTESGKIDASQITALDWTGQEAAMREAIGADEDGRWTNDLLPEIFSPDAIVIPDTSMIAQPSGSIGRDGNFLTLHDNATIGGKKLAFHADSSASQFVKAGPTESNGREVLASFPLPAQKAIVGTKIKLTGSVTFWAEDAAGGNIALVIIPSENNVEPITITNVPAGIGIQQVDTIGGAYVLEKFVVSNWFLPLKLAASSAGKFVLELDADDGFDANFPGRCAAVDFDVDPGVTRISPIPISADAANQGTLAIDQTLDLCAEWLGAAGAGAQGAFEWTWALTLTIE